MRPRQSLFVALAATLVFVHAASADHGPARSGRNAHALEHYDLGLAAERRGDVVAARDQFQEARRLLEQADWSYGLLPAGELGPVLTAIGRTCAALDDLECQLDVLPKALPILEESLPTSRYFLLETLLGLASLGVRLDRVDEARAHLTRARELLGEVPGSSPLGERLMGLEAACGRRGVPAS